MKISEIMTRNPESVGPDATLTEAAETMRRLDVGAIPVRDGDRLVGMLTDRDITIRATAEGKNPERAKVREFMTPDVIHAYDDQDVREAARLMEEHQIRRLVVMDRNQRPVGIVSLGDLATETGDEKLSGEALEEISEPAKPRR